MKLDSAVFYSNNISAAVDFYINIVGLKLDYQAGDTFASFYFDNGVRLGIKRAVEEREKPGLQSIFIEVDDIHSIYKTMRDKEVSFYKALVDNSYGLTFSILDPDDNKVLFIQRNK